MSIFTKYNEKIKYFTNVTKFCDHKLKISLIGCGKIGGTCVASLIYTQISANIALIEPIEENFGAEKLLYESLIYCPSSGFPVNVSYSNDIAASVNSNICLICLEYRKKNKTNSDATISANINNFLKFIPEIVKYSPNVIIIVLTYPFTILTQICYKLAKIPKNRIIGIGTSLSTSEFKTLLARKFDLSPTEVNGFVIGLGYHGFKVPLWSTATICGTLLNTMVPFLGTANDPLNLYQEFSKSQTNQEKLFLQRGPPRWTLGLFCAKICNAIINDTEEVFTVTANLKGLYGIKKTCCVSVPCSIGRNGISSIISIQLNTKESEDLTRAVALSSNFLKHILKKFMDGGKLLNYFNVEKLNS